VGIVGLILLVVLAEQNPQPSAFQLKIYTSILALSAAAFAAVVPGLLQVRFSAAGIAIRAVGAIAVFVLILWYEPAQTQLTSAIGVTLDKPDSNAEATQPPQRPARTPESSSNTPSTKRKQANTNSTVSPPAPSNTARDTAESPVASSTSPAAASFTGRWIGNVQQRGYGRYRIALDIRDMRVGEVVADVEYPGMCVGRWRLDSSTERIFDASRASVQLA